MSTKTEEGITDATGSLRHDDALERVRRRAISHRCEDAAPRLSALAYDRSGAVRRVGAEEFESFVQTVRLALYKVGRRIVGKGVLTAKSAESTQRRRFCAQPDVSNRVRPGASLRGS